MTGELAVAQLVAGWAARALPGEPDAAARAIAVAERSLAAGASVGEAYAEARRFLASWERHPAHHRRRPVHLLRPAS